MKLKKGVKELVAEANAKITTFSFDEAKAKLGQPGVLFVDLRDVRELERDGKIPGAFHAPRGMLEFWADPESPYYKPVFNEDTLYVLYCRSGHRSALATAALMEMGLPKLAHIGGGYTGWVDAGGATEAYARKQK